MSEVNANPEMNNPEVEAVPEARWYVAHTYSGYEKKVKMDIENTVKNRHLEDQILEVSIPLENVVEVKNGKEKEADRKLFPGYVLVHMYMNDDSWYVVRNTRGVTGFVGPGSKPVPLTDAEVAALGIEVAQKPDEEKRVIVVDFEIGDTVKVISGAWEGKESVVKAINPAKGSLTVTFDFFGRETPVELSFTEVKRI
jgi:transcriptional antiterminator NusG